VAQIETTRLVAAVLRVAVRVLQTVQEPAVQKAWGEAVRDVAKAGTSLAAAFTESRAAFRGSAGFASG
jgi:hypothetical protein